MSATDVIPQIPPNIDAIAGPLLIGHLLNWCLFGALTVQVCMYYLSFPHDRPFSKYFVMTVYLWEAAQTFMLTDSAFDAFARGYGNLNHLDKIGTIWFTVPIMSGVVAFAGQSFYAYRIHILSQSKIIAALILLLATVQLAGSIACGTQSKKAKRHSQFLGRDAYITTGIWTGGSAVCDLIIAICMTFSLSRRSTGMRRTSVLLKRIILLTIETGTVTAVIAILTFILSILPNRPNYYLAPVGILGKLYANSIMAVFNGRIKTGDDTIHHSSTGDHASGSMVRPPRPGQNAYEMGVGVSVTKEQVSFPPTSGWVKGEDNVDGKFRGI
ncbi:hypothetical protein CPC08DRAFT_748638 [Agrocybe pediades]|nr:hypothetical protein CPC08DRAFT_748638 [Agrocybe pediades]